MAEETATASQETAEAKPAEPEPTLTQSDVDRIVADRLQRERAKFADYPELKKAAQRLAEVEESSKSESEKAVEKARREAAAEAEARTAERFTGLLLRSTVLGRATALFEDPEDALTVDLDGLTLQDDGSVDTSEVDRRLAELLKRKPHWAKAQGKRFGDMGLGPRDAAEPVPTDPRGRIAAGLRMTTPGK